jgi:hypothetical protein
MAFFDTTWYLNAGDQSTTGYYAVTKWATGTVYAAGVLRRQNAAPAVNSERVFVCIVAGTSHATTEPTWVITRGGKTTDNTVTWQECTGASAVNGDVTNTPNWTTVKNAAVTLGQIIKRNNAASYQICSTAGTTGNGAEPSFSDTAGTTTADNTVTWTSLGVVGNFTGGQAPHARANPACATNWFAAGNTIYVGDNHAENVTSANITLSPAGTSGTTGALICHDHTGSYPPAASNLKTGAVISTTTSGNFTWSAGGAFYIYGVTFKVGVSGVGAAFLTLSPQGSGNLLDYTYFDQCAFWIASTSAPNATISLGSTSVPNAFVWNNCTVKFGNVAQYINTLITQFTWRNTGPILATGSSVPTTLFNTASATGNLGNTILEALDLSQCSGSLISSSGGTAMGVFLVKDCKLHASATITTPTSTGMNVQLVRSDSSTATYKSSRSAYEGNETTETTITRVGTMTDPGGQAQSRKIVTTANSLWQRPYKGEAYAIWNNATGSAKNVDIFGTINSASLPNNDEIWIEVEYLGDASSTLGTIATTTKATILTAGAAVTSDGSTWNGGGSGAGWSPFKLRASITPQLAGWVNVYIRAAKASTTYYIDPVPVIS